MGCLVYYASPTNAYWNTGFCLRVRQCIRQFTCALFNKLQLNNSLDPVAMFNGPFSLVLLSSTCCKVVAYNHYHPHSQQSITGLVIQQIRRNKIGTEGKHIYDRILLTTSISYFNL